MRLKIMVSRLRYLLLLFGVTAANSLLAQINVTPAQTALSLAKKLVGKGVVIQNVTMKCPSAANGVFTASPGVLGIDSGIVLTTGKSAGTVSSSGVNGASLFLASSNNGAPGDPALNQLAGQTTYDACSLEFDVIPQGDTLKFDYIFSSEEYINAVCGPYNDAFAFFISGPGITGQDNMALVPGTNIPVTINSVNNGIPGQGHTLANCTIMGPGSPFTAYYVDNSHGLYLTHNGRTTVLQAIHGVIPCGVYHLKMVIADAGNALYDSGVFLKAGSLQTGSYAVAAPISPLAPFVSGGVPFGIKGCLPGHFRIVRSAVTSYPQTIYYSFGGTAVKGVDFTVAADSLIIPAYDSVADVQVNGLVTPANGPKTVKIYIDLPYNCTSLGNAIDSASLVLYDSLHISIRTPDTSVCTGVFFPITVNGPDYLSYTWTPKNGLYGPAVKDPEAMVDKQVRYTVSGVLAGTSCATNSASVKISIRQSPKVTATGDYKVCERQSFGLGAIVSPQGSGYSYSWAGPGGFNSTNQNPFISFATAAGNGLYTVHVVNDTNLCRASDSVYVHVVVTDTPVVASPVIICKDKQDVQLFAKGRNLIWYAAVDDSVGSEMAPTVATNVIGEYNYYVSQTVNGCESNKSNIDVYIEKCCDGVYFIPDAFTPNNDGLNDKFEVKKDYGYTIEKLQIYNRWGQMIFDGHGETSWDGRFGGEYADVGSYFYYLKMNCINGGEIEKKGTIILIR